MHRSARRALLILTVLMLTKNADVEAQPASPQAVKPQAVLALLTQVEGEARVLSADRTRAVPARVRQAVAEGAYLKLADGARVTLVCVNAAVRQLEESSTVTPELCRDAAEPTAQGLVLNFDTLELVGEPRGQDFDQRPVLVSPRCPAGVGLRLGCYRLLEPPAVLSWFEAPDVDTYHWELTGPARYERLTVSAAAACSQLEESAGRRLCSLPWPAESWPLKNDSEHRLEVVAVSGSEWVRSGKTLLRPLRAAEAELVRKASEALSRLGLDAQTEALTRAAIYSGTGLVNEAVWVLESAAERTAAAVLEVALGDAYLNIDLPELAVPSYRRALESAGEDADLRRAAEDGLGQALKRLDLATQPAQPGAQEARLGSARGAVRKVSASVLLGCMGPGRGGLVNGE